MPYLIDHFSSFFKVPMKYTSALLTAASGKLRGIVASHNRGGSYFRGLTVPTNPNTAQQQSVRNNLASLQVTFANTLTGAQRTGWQTYATNTPVTDALGHSITLTGQQMFVKCNSLRLQAGLSVIAAPPGLYGLAALTLPVPTIIAAGTTASVAITNTDAWAGEVGGALLIYASRPFGGTINYFKGPYRYAGKVAGAVSPPTSPATVTLPFTIGSATTKMGFRFVAVRADGRPSPELFQTATA